MKLPRESEFKRSERRFRLIGYTVLTLVVLLAFSTAFARIYADYLWHVHDTGTPQVFLTPLKTKALLFVAGWIVCFLVMIVSGRLALNTLIILGREPQTIADHILQRVLNFLQSSGPRLVLWLSVVVSFFFAVALSTNWDDYLRFTHAESFGRNDPVFGLDVSFYVFKLPFLSSLAGWLLSVWLFAALVAGMIYVLIRSSASLARMPMTTPTIRVHFTVVAALGLGFLGMTAYLNRYGLMDTPNSGFHGPGYATMKEIGARTVVAFALWIFAALTLLNIRMWKAYVMPAAGVIVVGLIEIIGVRIYPGIVQSYEVKPNELALQKPYISNAIAATRWAYNLDSVAITPVQANLRPTEMELADARETIENMRLWDPDVLRANLQTMQSFRNYYVFQDIDVDRYEIEGKQRLIMLGARDLLSEGLPERSNTWQNVAMQYTHGNGVVAVRVNGATDEGTPEFLLKDAPPVGVPDLKISEPRIYFSDRVDQSGFPTDRYVIVRTELPEFDYSSATEESTHKWTGTRGIPISGAFTRLLFALCLGDQNLLLTHGLTNESKLLWRRSIRIRAKAILPWLTWDQDPYIAIIGGRLTWILDGYSATDGVPYSAESLISGEKINYVRNSVKMTIDAYDGSWKAYAMDADEPIMKCYSRIYPNILTPVAEAPAELKKHFRYAEGMFMLQSLQLGKYHLTDPVQFYRAEDVWNVAHQTTSEGTGSEMAPYYVQMRLPDEKKDAFMLILPFTPAGRANMIGWLAAHCDPEDYGKLTLYRFQNDRNINGPAQQEAKFDNDVEISKMLTLLNQQGSRIRHGNLLVVPIGKSVMYVKPLFLETNRPGLPAIPELKLVLLAFANKVVFANSYEKALEALIGKTAPQAPIVTTPDKQTPEEPPADLKRALQLLDQGDAALKNGDWAAYGKAQSELKKLLRELAGRKSQQ